MAAGYLFGVGAVLLFWVSSGVLTKRIEPWALAVTDSTVKGQKQRDLSASKLQILVWTYVTLFAYGSVFGARVLGSEPKAALDTLPGIPISLLGLMGLSVATAAGSKGVTVSYKAQGRVEERSGGAVTNPKGDPDLVKAQMLVWTFVAAGIYLYTVVTFIAAGSYDIALPEVDGALLVLMGASQGAYIGDKLVSRDIRKTPKLESMQPLQGPAGTKITILGENFGDEQGANFVSLNDKTIRSQADGLVSWSNLQIEVNIPVTFKAGDRVTVRVHRDGEWSEKLFFNVTT